MKKYYVAFNDGEYDHESKGFDTLEEAEAVARVIRENFDEEFFDIEIVAR